MTNLADEEYLTIVIKQEVSRTLGRQRELPQKGSMYCFEIFKMVFFNVS